MTPEELKKANDQAEANQRYHNLFLLVNRSGRGHTFDSRLIEWREKLHNSMRQMARDGATIGQIEKYVLGKIHDEEDGSIR